eukprot:GHVT01068468.1.p1 GENE.GHVT01068468.1~~GHVT01068468.1.p1  ORF type:complete len:407 (+),score=28.86 GHVT01068468.1:808-2028(+)
MKGWTGAAAFTAALSLLLGLSNFAACNVINDSQLDNFSSLGAGTSQVDSSALLGANTLTADSLYSEGAQTCMTVQTGMHATACEPVFASKLASRRSKLQSTGSASGSSATQTKGTSRKLKKRHVFIGLGAISIVLAAALGGGFLALSSPSSKSGDSSTTSSSTSSEKVTPKLGGSSSISSSTPKPENSSPVLLSTSSSPESQPTDTDSDGFGSVVMKVQENEQWVEKKLKLPMESNKTSFVVNQRHPYETLKQHELLSESFRPLFDLTGYEIYSAIVHRDGLTAFRAIMLSKMFSIPILEAAKLQESLYTGNDRPLPLDLDHPINTFPVMAEVEKVYKADPKDWESVTGVLFEYFSRGEYTRKTAKNAPYYATLCRHVAKSLDKIPDWSAKFPPTIEAFVKATSKK